jgi:hypothetical protein
MSVTVPEGALEWGQAGVYNAVDDRLVIAAVTRNRVGLTWPAVVEAQAGLSIVVRGGWLGVASCGDRTSAIVGSRTDQVVSAIPGPPTGTRQDVLWCDVSPDDAIWQLRIIDASAMAGRPGIPIAFLTVPANATLASQIGIRPADATLERRLIALAQRNDTRTAAGNAWNNSDTLCWTDNVIMEPGQWYRVRFTCSSLTVLSGSLDLRIGIGWHNIGTSDNTSVLSRASAIGAPRLGQGLEVSVEHVFRHPVTAVASNRHWDGRIWTTGSGTFRPTGMVSLTGGNTPDGAGYGLMITVEDIGS